MHKLWAITAKVKLKEGDASSATVNQNDSGLIKMKLKNWILLAFCFTERNKSYAQTSHEASLPQERYMKIERFQREKLIDGIDPLGRKIEFTKNSEFQSGPKVVAPTSMRIR